MCRLYLLVWLLLAGSVGCELDLCEKSLDYLIGSDKLLLSNRSTHESNELNSLLPSDQNECSFVGQFIYEGDPVRFKVFSCKTQYQPNFGRFNHSEEAAPIVFCLPATCSKEELSQINERYLKALVPNRRVDLSDFRDFLSAKRESKKNAIQCRNTRDNRRNEFRLDSYAFIVFTLVLAVLIIIATTLDCLVKSAPRAECEMVSSESEANDQQTISSQRVKCCAPANIKRFIDVFSIRSSINRLTAVDRDATISCIYGLKVLSIIWIIVGHTYIFSASIAENYLQFKNSIRHQFLARLVLNCSFAVDTFFLSSGFLCSYLLVRRRSINPDFWKLGPMLKFCFNRYWRLTPVYAFVLWFYTSVLNRLGDGPFWYRFEARNCEKNWWHNLLYFNSYDRFSEECMSHTWYLSNDMQFSIVSPAILAFVLSGSSRSSFLLVAALMLASSTITFAISYRNELTEMNGFLDLNNDHNYINLIYQKSYCRIGAYLVGLLTGYLINKPELMKRIDRSRLLAIGDVTSSILLVCTVFVYSTNWSFVACAFYFSLSRVVWSVAVCWLIVSCHLRPDKLINRFLSIRVFAWLSKLTYSVYLIHPIMLTFYFYTQTQSITVNHSNIFFFASLATIFSFVLAFLINLIIEVPFSELNILKKKK